MKIIKELKGKIPVTKEVTGNSKITFTEVLKILYNCLKYKVENFDLLDICIHDILKIYNNNFGTWEEYFNFNHIIIKTKILELYNYHSIKS